MQIHQIRARGGSAVRALAFALLAALLATLPVTPAVAEGELPALKDTLFDCPFMQTSDPFNFDGLISSLRALLETKIAKNDKCRAPINQLVSALTATTNHYSTLDPGMKADITKNVYSAWYTDLATRLTVLEASGQGEGTEAVDIRTTLGTVDTSLHDNEITGTWEHLNYGRTKENQFRTDFYNNVNSVLQSLQAADPQCVDIIGGWQAILPSLLGMASLATGFTPFAGAQVAGAALQVSANMALLLQDINTKRAANDLIKLQNDQILACTYYSIKYSACEYKRAYALSQRTDEIRRILERDLSCSEHEDFDQLFRSMQNVPLLESVFTQVATMGTPLTMDLELLYNYLQALRADPFNLPASPPAGASDREKKTWLIFVANRGITVSEVDMNGPISIDRQIEQAVVQIKKFQAIIQTAEALIAEKRSFEDLRHELDARFSGTREEVAVLRTFLDRMMASLNRDGTPRIPIIKQGAIIVAQEMLEALQAFLSVERGAACPADTPPALATPVYCYTTALNTAGKTLFEAMARGALAQVSKQAVLTLGRKATERVERALQMVEQQFLFEDLQNHRTGRDSYSEYRRDRIALYTVINNYEQFTPLATTFRPEKIQTAIRSFEKGFGKEMRRMVRRALKSKSEIAPEIRGKSAPHLCSLFASSLKKMWFPGTGKHLLAQCREKAPELDLLAVVAPGKTRINYDDPCFYVDYARTIKSQKLLLDRYRQWDRPRR